MADLAVQITNNATGQLDAGISAAALTLTMKVGEGAEFPSTAGDNYFYVTLQKADGNWEIVKVTTRTADVFDVIVRNQDSSTGAAQAFTANDIVSLRPCAQIIEDMITEIVSHQIQLYAPVGTKMYFYCDDGDVPDGWTYDAGVADVVLAIKGGSDDYNVAGGQVVGDWDQGTHVHAMNDHTHTTPDHILTEAEMPSHTHTTNSNGGHNHDLSRRTGNPGSSTNAAVEGGEGDSHPIDQSGHVSTEGAHTHTALAAGSGDAHNHGATGLSGTADGGASQTPATYRPEAANGVIATKD